MKTLTVTILALTLAACAKSSPSDTAQIQNPPPSFVPWVTPSSATDATTCQIYNACSGLFGADSSCVSTTLEAADHPEIDSSYFLGHTCLTYQEDHVTQSFPCGQYGQYRCTQTIIVQQALPTLNL